MTRAVWDHPVSRYARDVIQDRRPEGVLGKWVKRACRRHLRDLVHGPARGLRFDVKAADRVVAFFRRLRHTTGAKWAGRPVELVPWQVFCWGNIFGWKRADGTRRFRTVYIETGKKQGKTTAAAGTCLYVPFFDEPQETGAQAFTAATKRDQAKLTWNEAKEMIRCSPGLGDILHVWGSDNPKAQNVSITCLPRNQRLEPLGKDSQGLDGINPHLGLVDELHKLRDRAIWDILDSSRGMRTQPLLMAITNSGYDQTTVCFDQRRHSEKVLDGVMEDDAFFAFVCGIDKGDRWDDESKWVKANPGLGDTVAIEFLREQCRKAKSSPSFRSIFRRYHCGEWLAVDELAIDMDRWTACGAAMTKEVLDGLKRRPCLAGLDLASVIDFCALDLYFPPVPEDPHPRVLCWLWRPEDTLDEFAASDLAPYREWMEAGLLRTVPGGSIDFAFLREHVRQILAQYRVRYVGYDPWQADETRQGLELEGFKMVKIRQGHVTLSAPCRRLEQFYMAGKIRHGGNEALSWMASNVVWRRDANNNFIPDKGKAGKHRRHIDGISALLTAMACEGLTPPPPKRPYLKRGVRFLKVG